MVKFILNRKPIQIYNHQTIVYWCYASIFKGNFLWNYPDDFCVEIKHKGCIHIVHVSFCCIIYNKCWCCLIFYYIILNNISPLHPLLWPLTYIVVGGGQCYFLFLNNYVTTRSDWTIRAVCSMIPELTYHQWHTRLPVVHLVTQFTRGSPNTAPRAELLT